MRFVSGLLLLGLLIVGGIVLFGQQEQAKQALGINGGQNGTISGAKRSINIQQMEALFQGIEDNAVGQTVLTKDATRGLATQFPEYNVNKPFDQDGIRVSIQGKLAVLCAGGPGAFYCQAEEVVTRRRGSPQGATTLKTAKARAADAVYNPVSDEEQAGRDALDKAK